MRIGQSPDCGEYHSISNPSGICEALNRVNRIALGAKRRGKTTEEKQQG